MDLPHFFTLLDNIQNINNPHFMNFPVDSTFSGCLLEGKTFGEKIKYQGKRKYATLYVG